MRVATVQMQITDGFPEGNRRTLLELLDSSSAADLYLAPELWTCGYLQDSWADIADSDTPETIKWMGEQSKRRNAWFGGTLITRSAQGRLVNRFVLFNRSGQLIAYYDKAHLFGPLKEKEYLKRGNVLPPIIDIEGLRVSPTICYDLRFPELFRRLALHRVDLFLVASEWPQAREKALRTLSEARAIESQAFLLLANRVGRNSSGVDFGGGSGLYGPEGVIAVEDRPESRIISAAIDLNQLHFIRKTLPVFSDRIKGIDYD